MTDKPPVALEQRGAGADGRRHAPSVARNRQAIGAVLAPYFAHPAQLLEIASGTGEHGAYFTAQFPALGWTYSDIDPGSLASQQAWKAADTTGRLYGPLQIDAASAGWGEAERAGHWDAVFSANMVHIAPLAAAEGLLQGAGRLLKPGGRLFLYGPFARAGIIAPSNAAFCADLKAREKGWGVRDLDREIIPVAEAVGLHLSAVTEMPANNLTVVFSRRGV